MATYPECKFYLGSGKCSHKDAPNPRHSWCIGKDACGSWDEEIEQQVSRYEKQLERMRQSGAMP